MKDIHCQIIIVSNTIASENDVIISLTVKKNTIPNGVNLLDHIGEKAVLVIKDEE